MGRVLQQFEENTLICAQQNDMILSEYPQVGKETVGNVEFQLFKVANLAKYMPAMCL